MAYSLDLLCAKLVNLGYVPGFLFAPRLADLSPFPGRKLVSVIWGVDPDGVGRTGYGLVTDGPEGLIASIRGTQVPVGSLVEWVRDFECLLSPCPFASGAMWHDGIGKDYLTLVLDDGTPVGKGLAGAKGLTVAGHSKGGPLAIYLATEVGLQGNPPACVAFAPCKPGDKAFGRAAVSACSSIHLWANPKDIVPHTPLTITALPPPFINEDYEFPVPLSPLDPGSVTPAVPGDWDSAHNLAGAYIRMMEALP